MVFRKSAAGGPPVTFVEPRFSRQEVRRAGEILVAGTLDFAELQRATDILTNWRASHGYVLNTFQSTLRNKLERIDASAIVGQRLKRAPSVLAKLRRFKTMKLPQMQDIAGLRAIVETSTRLRKLHENYNASRFTHELIKTNDYVATPKPDGYRSIHLVYKYNSLRAPEYEGLFVELQMRTRSQHAWATAVETVDAFLGQAIKAGNPTAEWAEFFLLASAAFALAEKSPVPAAFADISAREIVAELKRSERRLGVLVKLRGFTVAADKIVKDGNSSASYHLITLNTSTRTLTIRSFPFADQELANREYAEVEARVLAGAPLDPVLVTGGRVESLRKAYPNYFLDTQAFVQRVERIISGTTAL